MLSRGEGEGAESGHVQLDLILCYNTCHVRYRGGVLAMKIFSSCSGDGDDE